MGCDGAVIAPTFGEEPFSSLKMDADDSFVGIDEKRLFDEDLQAGLGLCPELIVAQTRFGETTSVRNVLGLWESLLPSARRSEHRAKDDLPFGVNGSDLLQEEAGEADRVVDPFRIDF